jgi:sarcosine oxidase, subunit alpha
MTAGPYRLEDGGQLDRTRAIPFRFDGRILTGHPGDTLASALLANGVRTVARSFKFHRPRGIYSCGMEEPSALVQLGRGARKTPTCRAPTIELHEGLEAFSQAGWPSVRFDLGRAFDFTAPLWSAGFYNKTFIWPKWRLYEGIIRQLAGLGRAPSERDPDRYDVGNIHCDMLVVGGGRSGLTAALEAARAGARVVLVEQQQVLGGRVAWDGSRVGDRSAASWVSGVSSELNHLGVQVLSRTTAVAYHDHDVVMLLERVTEECPPSARERLWIVRAQRVALATGVIEQPLIFDNNERPGIMLAGAMHEYLCRYGVAAGTRVVIATNNDSAYALASDLRSAGVQVVALTDTRREGEIPEAPRTLMRNLGVSWFPRAIPIDTRGFAALKELSIGRLSDDSGGVEACQTFECDALAVSGGFSPAVQLFAQAGGKLQYEETSRVLRPVAPHASIRIVGSAAELVAAGPRVSPVGNTRRQWVDLLHDVTVADLELAQRENYTHVEHVKRYTTLGMAPDQGKTATAAALDVLARLRNVSASTLGHTTLRPPLTPVTLGAIVGRETGERFAPKRLLPMHDWHVACGAILHDFGGWQRPVAYPRGGETRAQAAWREQRAVRSRAGLFDGSSLGKIELKGPDALEFLDHFYINNLRNLQAGRARYGLMLRETGILFDDGTVVALAPDHLLITTTSGNAQRVYQWLEEWQQCEWPTLRVAITPVTEQWATVAIAGPKARSILARLDTDIDFSNTAFPHLAMREGRLAGLPARIYRVSFTGELTYEINVPADAAPQLWNALIGEGDLDGIQPLGTDALMTLRLEKGFLHLGADTDGTTVPDDVGWGKVASSKRADFIGKRSLTLPEHVKRDRLQLVGLTAVAPFITGSHLRLNPSFHPTDGWITSAGIASASEEPIAMAMLRGGREHIGKDLAIYDAGKLIGQARVVTLPFYDPSGDRLNA